MLLLKAKIHVNGAPGQKYTKGEKGEWLDSGAHAPVGLKYQYEKDILKYPNHRGTQRQFLEYTCSEDD